MIESVVNFISTLTLNAILFVEPASAEIREVPHRETVTTSAIMRIAELESRLAAASIEIQELRRELERQPKTVAIRLVTASDSYAVERLKNVLRDDLELKIVLDKNSNTLFLSGQPQQIRQAKVILNDLDENLGRVYFVVLKHAVASEAVKVAKAFIGDEREIKMTPDDRTNTVIIRANEQNFAAAEKLLLRLDSRSK
jgi:type II secretory pathway component GspD/PulD (secretin)